MGTTTADDRTELPARRTEPGSRWAWMLRVLALVAVFAIIAWARSRQVDIPFKDPHGKLFRGKLLDTAELLLAAVVIDVVVRWLRRRRDGVGLWSTLRHRWTPYRVVMILAGLVAYFVVYLCYRNLKSWDVFNTPRDAMLLGWDRDLFLGHSPAVLLHDLLGQDLAARLLTDLYESFSWLVTIALVAALAFTPTVRQAFVFLTAAMWAWILGLGSYYLIPSLGPFHAAPAEFAGLTRTSIQSTQESYVAQRDHLLAHPHASDAFAQISAFASLHCALTCLIFLMARYYGLRLVSWVAGLFLAGTLLATVYLGWHFAVDDVAGLAIAWVAVQLGKVTVFGSFRTVPTDTAGP
ncbi:phosphatase PAP2 family protein [Nocardioides cynanchi]|uniref:phosphatase PAP2 family protein n=1 Tax=Nocardioides cynanchi TaxID=2558918 RepID=UPI00178321CA|nr:phosphatase PAP2 family protein [Nocardioides cynanchi]